MPRILHILSQRPSLTGSGITLDAQVRFAAKAGWQQRVVVGVPHDDPQPSVGGLDHQFILPLAFETDQLPFPVPGMSDVMPYRSSVFSSMDEPQFAAYHEAWRAHLRPIITSFKPDIVHSHHLWILSSMLKDLAPTTPIVSQCHATGFRQMELCPGRKDEVRNGVRRNEAFVVLHREHQQQLCHELEVETTRVHIVGAGYRDDVFHARGRQATQHPSMLYVGKYSSSKGLPQLLDAVEILREYCPGLVLEVAGSGSGDEASALAARMASMPDVQMHGQLSQEQLAELARTSWLCVLPSFYEGIPLVLVETLACGCRLVATGLPGIKEQLRPSRRNDDSRASSRHGRN